MDHLSEFSKQLKILKSNISNEDQILMSLLYFEETVCANLFSDLGNHQISTLLSDIWYILFHLSAHSSTTVKLESSRATSIFLSRLLPYHNELIQKTFSKVVETLDVNTPLILASLAFMSNYTSPPLLLQYINVGSIADHIDINDSCYPFIFDKLGCLGSGVLLYILKIMLNQVQKNQNRHLIRSIGSLIRLSPNVLLPNVLNLNDLGLFAYIFTNVEFDYKKFNISHIVDLICKTLENDSSSPLDKDNSLQILSLINPKVSVFQENDSKLMIQIDIFDHSIKLNPDKFLDRSPFFLLPLPFSLLQPRENDSVLILTSKFKTIAKLTFENDSKFDFKTVSNLFLKYFKKPYNEEVSAAIIGFSTYAKKFNSPELINTILYGKISSWFHSFDVLRIIRECDVNKHILLLLYEFIISDNVKVSNEAMNVITSLTNHNTFELIVEFLLKKIDLFDLNTLKKVLDTLSSIFKENKYKLSQPNLNLTINILLEAIQIFSDDILHLTPIFRFLSILDISFLNHPALLHVYKIAMNIAEAYFAVIYGDLSEISAMNGETINGKHENHKAYRTTISSRVLMFIKDDVLHRSFDILNEQYSIDEYLPHFASTCKFLLNLPLNIIGSKKAMDFISSAFNFFPLKCSQFYEKNWRFLNESRQNNILQGLFSKLQFVSDLETIAIWCRIAVETKHFFNHSLYQKTIGVLNFTSAFFLVPNLKNMIFAASFSLYLYNSLSDGFSTISIFVESLSEEEKCEFACEISKISKELLKKLNLENCLQLNSEKHFDSDINQIEFSKDDSDNTFRINYAIYNGKINDVINEIQSLLTNKDNNCMFNLLEYNIPPSMREYISQWATLKKYVSIIPFENAISLVRTEFSKLATEILKTDPNRVINYYLSKPKVKYNEILDLCTLSNFISFNTKNLFKLAAQFSMNAEKTKKMRASYLFLATVLKFKFLIPEDFPRNFAERANQNFSILPLKEISLVLYNLVSHSKVDNVFLFFCRKILMAGSIHSLETGLIGSILIRHSKELISLNKSLNIDFNQIVNNLLQSEHLTANANNPSFQNWYQCIIPFPSMILNACRVLRSSKQIKNIMSPMLYYFEIFQKSPIVNEMLLKALTHQKWDIRIRSLKKFIVNDQSLPEFYNILKLIRFFLKSIHSNQDEISQLCFFVINKVLENPHNIKHLEIALLCLVIYLSYDNDNSHIQAVYMDSQISWLNGLTEKDSHLTMKCALCFCKILEMKIEAQTFFALISCQYFRCAPRFFSVFPVIGKYYLKYQKCKWANDILASCIPIIRVKCHKGAIEAIIKGMVNESIKLAMFEKDCDESDDILKSLNLLL